MTIEVLLYKIIFIETVQKKNSRRFTAVAVLFVIFLIGGYIAAIMGVSIIDYVVGQYQFVIIPPLLFFAFNMALRQYRILKIRRRYSDGSDGFIFNDMLKKSDFDELNQQNQPIDGAFNIDLAVKTKNGVFVGEKKKNIIFFTGIPYAKPPVGELRWKAPEPLPESNDVFEAKFFGSSAIQVDYNGSFLKNHRQSEDCLTLNICVGTKKPRRKSLLSSFFITAIFHTAVQPIRCCIAMILSKAIRTLWASRSIIVWAFSASLIFLMFQAAKHIPTR